MAIATAAYKITNWHIDRVFHRAGLVLKVMKTEKYTIEYWDNKLEEKPVILMIHGFGAKAKYQWYKQLSALKKNYRVVIPNLMYFGETRPHVAQYRVEDQVEMIRHFAETLQIDKYTLMGASYGGLISAELAIKYPKKVQKLILVDAAMKYIYEDDAERVCNYFEVENISELFVPSKPSGLKLLYIASIGSDILTPPIATLRRFHEELYQGTFKEKRELVKDLILIRESYAEHVYSFKVPVHLIWGDLDIIVPPERAVRLRDHIGGDTTLDILKKGGHMPNMNKPRAFNKLLVRYLSQ